MTSLQGLLRASLILLLTPGAHATAQGPSSAPAPEREVLLAKATAAGQLRPREAAEAAEKMLALDSLDAEASWRAAVAYVDLGKVTPDERKDRVRDSLYLLAERHARHAVRLAPQDANAHFALAAALGKAALTKGAKERVKYAVEIRDAAMRSLAVDPRHDGSWHVLGRWHAEIERLSNIEEFFAKKFLGARVFGEASWEEAARNLEQAAALRPDYIYHRLDLAEVYVDMRRYADARRELDTIVNLPTLDAMDPEYRRQAEAIRSRIARK
ncbi:MAG TPA: tetratricopeptide repeat protein [Gemmatimonadales bacterium]